MSENKIITISENDLVRPLPPDVLQRLAADESEPDFSDIPELTEAWLEAARTSREQRRAKCSISIRLDPDIIEFFKKDGARYQSRINAVLRAYVDAVRSA